MTIRSRLLLLLLPTLISFVVLIALFFYFNWSHEILDSFKARLQSIVTTTSHMINPETVVSINQHLQDADIEQQQTYQKTKNTLLQLKQKLGLQNLYIVRIEPVKEGESILPNGPLTEGSAWQENTYRQIYLVDTNEKTTPGAVDFSETDEHHIYFTKKPLVTPPYETRLTHERFITAYAPILNDQGEVIALLGADLSIKEVDQKLTNAFLAIALSACATIIMVIGSVFLIADRMSKPVQQLNQAALEIAAGNYDNDIHVQGPREIVELANTLNIMSECLADNMNRLKERSLIRERMYGEKECAVLLQEQMLRKVEEDFSHPYLHMRTVIAHFAPIQKGVLLKTSEDKDKLCFSLIEADASGFNGLYQLCTHYSIPIENFQNARWMECCFHHANKTLTHRHHILEAPLIWSIRLEQFLNESPVQLRNQDMVFLYNSSFLEQFEHLEHLKDWLKKILRHFARDGLDTIQTMVTNELNFMAKRAHTQKNFYIVGLQMTPQ